MNTFLYNINTKKRIGDIREGRYLVDGARGLLPDFLVELEIEKRSDPYYNSSTQTLEYRSFADLNSLKWVEESYIRDLNQNEIDQRVPVSNSVDVCTPRQIRIALIQSGLSLSSIDDYINNIQDNTQREIARSEWEYALEIKKDHPLVALIASTLNLTQQQIDDVFNLASTL